MKSKLQILVVDDDHRMVKTICDILRIKGYETIAAYSGEEAVAKVKTQIPDCVLMDIKMPGIDGIEALRKLKQVVPDLSVILMSAFVTEDQVAEAKHLGVPAVLSKPIDVQQVLAFLDLLKEEQSILVIDDDPQFCGCLKAILQKRDYIVEIETEPDNVLDNLAHSDHQVILLDLNLGHVSGMDIMKKIHKQYPNKPVVLVTGYRNEMTDAIQQGLKVGAYTCLYKPLAIEKLFKVIEQINCEKLRVHLEKKY